jgi:hypothetical protein
LWGAIVTAVSSTAGLLVASWLVPKIQVVIACDKRKAFAQESEATKQSSPRVVWIASLRS